MLVTAVLAPAAAEHSAPRDWLGSCAKWGFTPDRLCLLPYVAGYGAIHTQISQTLSDDPGTYLRLGTYGCHYGRT
eukprot:scaffold195895_cov38-Prasinocladus_malaysianus.AAC.1